MAAHEASPTGLLCVSAPELRPLLLPELLPESPPPESLPECSQIAERLALYQCPST